MSNKEDTTNKTDTIKKEFLEALIDQRICGNVLAACLLIKRSRPYLYELKNSDPEFSKAWDHNTNMGRKLGCDIAENGLMNNVRKGNVTAQIFYLKSNMPDVYGDKAKLVPPDSPIQHTMSASPELKETLNKIAGLLGNDGK